MVVGNAQRRQHQVIAPDNAAITGHDDPRPPRARYAASRYGPLGHPADVPDGAAAHDAAARNIRQEEEEGRWSSGRRSAYASGATSASAIARGVRALQVEENQGKCRRALPTPRTAKPQIPGNADPVRRFAYSATRSTQSVRRAPALASPALKRTDTARRSRRVAILTASSANLRSARPSSGTPSNQRSL